MFNAFGSLVLGSHMLIRGCRAVRPASTFRECAGASASAMVSVSGDFHQRLPKLPEAMEQAARDQLAKDWAAFSGQG